MMKCRYALLLPVCLLLAVSDAIAEKREPVGTFYGRVLNYDCTVPEIENLAAILSWRRSTKSFVDAGLSVLGGLPSWNAAGKRAMVKTENRFAIPWDDSTYKEISIQLELNGFRSHSFDNYGSRRFQDDTYQALLQGNRPDNRVILYYDAAYHREKIRRHTEATTKEFSLHDDSLGFNSRGPAEVAAWKDYGQIRDYHIELERPEGAPPVLRLIAPRGGFIQTQENGMTDIALPVKGYRPVLEIVLSEEHRDASPRRLNFLTRTMRGRAYGYMSLTYQFVSIEQQLARVAAGTSQGRRLDDQVKILVYHDLIISENEVAIGNYAAIEHPVLKARQCGGFMPLSPDGPLNAFNEIELLDDPQIDASVRQKAAATRSQRREELETRNAIRHIENEIQFGAPTPEWLDTVARQHGETRNLRIHLLEQADILPETIQYLYTMYDGYELETYRFAQNANTPADVLLELCDTMSDEVVEQVKKTLRKQREYDRQETCDATSERAREEWRAK